MPYTADMAAAFDPSAEFTNLKGSFLDTDYVILTVYALVLCSGPQPPADGNRSSGLPISENDTNAPPASVFLSFF